MPRRDIVGRQQWRQFTVLHPPELVGVHTGRLHRTQAITRAALVFCPRPLNRLRTAKGRGRPQNREAICTARCITVERVLHPFHIGTVARRTHVRPDRMHHTHRLREIACSRIVGRDHNVAENPALLRRSNRIGQQRMPREHLHVFAGNPHGPGTRGNQGDDGLATGVAAHLTNSGNHHPVPVFAPSRSSTPCSPETPRARRDPPADTCGPSESARCTAGGTRHPAPSMDRSDRPRRPEPTHSPARQTARNRPRSTASARSHTLSSPHTSRASRSPILRNSAYLATPTHIGSRC